MRKRYGYQAPLPGWCGVYFLASFVVAGGMILYHTIKYREFTILIAVLVLVAIAAFLIRMERR